jgi:hypothetical protein
MPGIDRFEVLQWIRREPGLQNLRVVLTASDSIRDVKPPTNWERHRFW